MLNTKKLAKTINVKFISNIFSLDEVFNDQLKKQERSRLSSDGVFDY